MEQDSGVLKSQFEIHSCLVSVSVWGIVWVRAVAGLPQLRVWGTSVSPSWRVQHGLWWYPESHQEPSHMLLDAVAWHGLHWRWSCSEQGAGWGLKYLGKLLCKMWLGAHHQWDCWYLPAKKYLQAGSWDRPFFPSFFFTLLLPLSSLHCTHLNGPSLGLCPSNSSL